MTQLPNRVLSGLARGALDIFAPPTCCESGLASELALSAAALERRPRFGEPRCLSCDGPAFAPVPTCDVCRDMELDFLAAAAPYAGWWRMRIQQMKFRPEPALIEPFAVALADLLMRHEPDPAAVLVPIPPGNRRGILHGSAMTFALTEAIARRTGLKTCHALYRVQPGRPQRERSRQDRQSLSAEIYGCSAIPSTATMAILVDDVLTTGATIKAAVKALQQSFHDLGLAALVLARAGAPVA